MPVQKQNLKGFSIRTTYKMDGIIMKLIEEHDAFNEVGRNFSESGIAGTYKILQDSKLLPQLASKARKSDDDSEKIRSAGNTAYKAKDFKAAQSYYTRAVCCAELDGEQIAVAFANRSAVHYELQAYSDVIKDVGHALDTGKYPEDMKCKLYERRAKSYMALSQYQAALRDFGKVLSYIANDCQYKAGNALNGNTNQQNASCAEDVFSQLINGNLDPEGIISLLTNGKSDQERARRLRPLIQLIRECNGKPNLPQEKPKEPKLSHKPSKDVKSKYPAMEVATSPEMGKHVVAATSILPGDILAVEKPLVSVLIPEFHHSFCDNCKIQCHASIPCTGCTAVVFCSENCRQRGWADHHAIECDLLPTMVALGCQVNLLIGVRGLLLATRSGKDLQKFVNEQRNDTARRSKHKAKDSKTNRPPNLGHSEDFHSVHNLVTHEEDRSELQSLSVMVSVACIVHIMKSATRFFGCPSTQAPLDQNHTAAAKLIARYFMMAGCNAFEIRESGLSGADEPKVIGGALYPTLCLLNHSCDPDVTAYMSTEETRVLYAIKPVRKGEQLFISYGPEYLHNELAVRQKALKSKYFFTCKCTACVKNWPLADRLPEYPTFISHRVESTQGQRVFDACKKLPEIVHAADTGQISPEQMQVAAQCLLLYHKYVNRPWKYYFAAQRVIRQYYNNRRIISE